MAETLGSVTKTLIEHIEAHKLHMEFEASGVIHAGSHVIFDADGSVSEAADSAAFDGVIGFSIHDGLDTELVTIAMRAYAIVKGEAEAINLDAGPIELGPYNGTTNFREYLASSTPGNTVGHNLTQVTADGAEIRVALL